MMRRNPPLPVFDPTKDGNVFAWIVKTAPAVRAERQADDLTVRAVRRELDRIARRPLHPGA